MRKLVMLQKTLSRGAHLSRDVQVSSNVLKTAWRRAMTRVLAGRVINWSNVSGPISATIAVIAEQGWRPISPHHWRTECGTMEAVLKF